MGLAEQFRQLIKEMLSQCVHEDELRQGTKVMIEYIKQTEREMLEML